MNKAASWRSVTTLILIIAILTGYFRIHALPDAALISTLGGALLDILTAVVIVGIAGGLGRGVLRSRVNAFSDLISRPERIALEALLGLGIFSTGAVLLGLVGLYRGAAFEVALVIMAVWRARDIIAWLRDAAATARAALRPETGWTRLLLVVSLFLLVMALLHTLAPPAAFDALNYHLVGPQRYLADGRITAQPDNHFLGLSQGAEILYGVGMGLFGRETAAAPLHFAFGLLGLLSVGGLMKRYTDKAAAYLVAALLLSAFSIWLLFGWAYVDLAVMAYSAGAVVCAVIWRGQSRGSESPASFLLIMAGVFAGFALSVKYLSGAMLIALLIYAVWNAPRQAVRSGLLLLIPAGLVFLPWALKGLLLYGNPLYPFLFGGLNWDAGRTATFSVAGQGLIAAGSAWQLPFLPLTATLLGLEKGGGYSFTIGPWLLTTPFLLLLGWRWLDERGRILARDCALLGLPLLAFWIIMAAWSGIGSQTRLMMMAMPIAALAAGLGLHNLARWARKPLDMTLIVRIFIALTLIFSLLDAARHTIQSKVVPYLMASLSRDEYLATNITSGFDSFVAAMHYLETLPPGSQVRLMFEPRTYYCPSPVTCLGDMLFDHWARPLQGGAAPDEVFADWKVAGDDYLLLFNPGYQFNAQDERFAAENALFPPALERWMTPLWTDEGGWYTVYGWKP